MAHEKVYAICEDKCREETLTKKEITAQDAEFLAEGKSYTDTLIDVLGNEAHAGASSIQGTKSNITSATSLEELKIGVSLFLDAVVTTLNNIKR